jgi:hypothetical protein
VFISRSQIPCLARSRTRPSSRASVRPCADAWATSVMTLIICRRREVVRWRVGERREPPFVCAAVGGPVSAVADTASPLGCPRLVLGSQRRTRARWWACGASRHAVPPADAGVTRLGTPVNAASRRTGQRSAGTTTGLPSGALYGAGLPPAHRWVARHVPAPHGRGKALEQTLRLATPIAPQGAKGRHRLRPCHHKVESAGESKGLRPLHTRGAPSLSSWSTWVASMQRGRRSLT